MKTLAIDLGGTRVKLGLIEDGSLVRTAVHDVPRTSGSVLHGLDEHARALCDGAEVDAVAMCVPGLVDDAGTLVSLPGKHEGLEGTDLSAELRALFGVERTVVLNDALAYAIGEASDGGGKGVRRSVVVTIGTGVGVSVIERGAPVSGGIYGGGILGGFIPISDDSRYTDSAGGTGTIEALCAAERIVESCGGAYAGVPEVYEAFARGEAAARDGIARYRASLVRALVALASAHAPDRIILGGGPMRDGNPITPGIAADVNEHLFGSYRTEVVLAALGDSAALVGLGRLAEPRA